MTLPDERYQAIRMTEQLLRDLCDSTRTPRVPKEIRARASGCLRHYPGSYHLDQLAEQSPGVITARMEPLTRMVMQYDQERT